MNLINSFGFFVLGTFMRLLPIIAPSWALVDPAGAMGARELWLITTGYLIGGIGALFLLMELGKRTVVLYSVLQQRAALAREAAMASHARERRLTTRSILHIPVSE